MREGRTVRLADVAKVGAGNSAPQDKALFDGGSYPFFRTADVGRVKVGELGTAQDYLNERGIRGLKLHGAGTVLIPKSGASTFLDHRVVMAVDGYVSSHLATLYASEDVLDRRYLFWVMQTICARDVATDTSYPTLSLRQISEIEIPLPPLEEQRRIVGVLDEAFAAIATATANAKRNLANAQELFASELDALIREAQASFAAGPLIKQCVGMTVGHVGPMKDRYVTEGIPFLRSQNVRPFEISFDGMMFIDEHFDSELKKSRLRPGDIAVVRTGYPGTAAVIPEDMPHSNCADLVIIRPGKMLNPHFVAAFLNSNIGKRAISGELVGAAQKHFNVGSAKQVSIPLPSLDEQRALVDRVAEFSQEAACLKEVSQRRLRHLEALKSAILHTAFSGTLAERVPLAA